MLILFMIWF